MDVIATAVMVMTALAVFFGVVLAIAYRYLKVEEDPRIDDVEAMLPGSNCGACGEPGCRAFAEKAVLGLVSPRQCTVSSTANVDSIASYLGVTAGEIDKPVARLHCAGGRGLVTESAQYAGIRTCRGAAVVNAGGRGCVWGCLGLADCERSCTFDAIHMASNGLPVVNVDACTGCGDCVEACPLDLFVLEPLSRKLIVQCSSPLAGDGARAICAVACDACGRCALDSPPGAIEMIDGLPVIRDHSRVTPAATYRCPTGAIQWVEKDQTIGDETESSNLRKMSHA